MPPLWWFPTMALIFLTLYLVVAERPARLHRLLRFQTTERFAFTWSTYNPLRDTGLSHKEAISEIERLWLERHPHLDKYGNRHR